MIELVTFGDAPANDHGQVRELRIRWALEEAGLRYRVRSSHPPRRGTGRPLPQPVSEVPACIFDGVVMYESGAILLHIAEQSDVLMPRDPTEIAITRSWMFAGLVAVEPSIQLQRELDHLPAFQDIDPSIRAQLAGRIGAALDAVAGALEDRDYLCGRFTVADVLLVTTLRFLRDGVDREKQPVLAAYEARCDARPAFRKALADQMKRLPAPAQSRPA
jgi:glutathione S-transferase